MIQTNYKDLGFTTKQWQTAKEVNLLSQKADAFWLYAKRKDDDKKKVWIGLIERVNKFTLIKSVATTKEEWAKTTSKEKREIFKPFELTLSRIQIKPFKTN